MLCLMYKYTEQAVEYGRRQEEEDLSNFVVTSTSVELARVSVGTVNKATSVFTSMRKDVWLTGSEKTVNSVLLMTAM